MSRATLAIIACVLSTGALRGQQQAPTDGPLRVVAFATGHAIGYGGSGTSDSSWGGGGVGVALAYRLHGPWAAELSAGVESAELTFFRRSGGATEYERAMVTSYPVDLLARYHFATHSAWKPFLGAGAHYLPGPDSPVGRLRSQFAWQASAGVDYEFSPRFSLRIDARPLLGSDEVAYDPTLKAFVGAGWRF
jgi:outer membrane protein W